MIPEQIPQLLQDIRERYGKTGYAFDLDLESSATDLYASKLGGTPYWDGQQAFPTDAQGAPMQLLMQLNLERDALPAPMPQGGMLQIFLAKNDDMGYSYRQPTQQTGFRVVYHPTLLPNVTQQQVLDAGFVPLEQKELLLGHSPLFTTTGFLITHLRPQFMLSDNAIIDGIDDFHEAYDLPKAGCDGWSDLIFELIKANTDRPTHNFLGAGVFVQDDPREGKELARFDTVLCQLHSHSDKDFIAKHKEWPMIWGDVGIANFLIPRERLEACDFSDVLYTWDSY